TMYVPYRKAYLTGLNPLSFIAFFTIGELGMMAALAVSYGGGPAALWRQLIEAKEVLFWLLLGGFVWVIGDLFQQYAAKYIGISRGIPLSNTNQLWGLLWGILVFGELHGRSASIYAQVIGGSLLMAAGAGAIALSSVPSKEHARWKQAAEREGQRYGVNAEYVQAGLSGNETNPAANQTARRRPRSLLDYFLVFSATAVFIALGVLARAPSMTLNWPALAALAAALLIFLFACGLALWKVTRFN
ncbi:MAG: GRP family sugar transporter, partial [Candidatus Acidiferrum sp.]